jgi:putative peptide zinc metalloprotease protein
MGGIFLQQGQLLGYVSKRDRLIIRSVVAQDDIGLLRKKVVAVEVRLAENLGETVSAKIIRETPSASSQLPSAALGTLGGGDIAIDRVSRNNTPVTSVDMLFQIDLELAKGTMVSGLGERAYIRFDHGSEPLAKQWLRMGRQLVLSRLSM